MSDIKIISKTYLGEKRTSAYDTENEFRCIVLINGCIDDFMMYTCGNLPDEWIIEEVVKREKNKKYIENEYNKTKLIWDKLQGGGLINKEEYEYLKANESRLRR